MIVSEFYDLQILFKRTLPLSAPQTFYISGKLESLLSNVSIDSGLRRYDFASAITSLIGFL